LHNLLLMHGYANKLDPANRTVPFDRDIMIMPRVKLKLNFHGCVNSLEKECTIWMLEHARDGTNKTSRARWPY
jgi:hypothetical protein